MVARRRGRRGIKQTPSSAPIQLLATLVLVAGVAGLCAAPLHEETAPHTEPARRYHGRVSVIGNDPHTQLVLETTSQLYALQDGQQSQLLEERYQGTFVVVQARLISHESRDSGLLLPLLEVVDIIATNQEEPPKEPAAAPKSTQENEN